MRQFPLTRLRRTRMQAFSRQLVQENHLRASDLIWPVFVLPGQQQRQRIDSMPGVERLSLDLLLPQLHDAWRLGIPAVALFPVVGSDDKSPLADAAWDDQGLMATAIRTIRAQLPELGIIADIALDPYTSHGQDGIVNELQQIDNDLTLAALGKQALCYAAAGAQILAPSDMMDGRIGHIRQLLEQQGHSNTQLLSYAAKYASAFYGPFRDAVGSAGQLKGASKASYQMDPANGQEALHEVALDLSEGADMVMVKPGMPYLDVLWRVKQEFQVPTFAYQVSGEYSLLQLGLKEGLISEQAVWESLLAFKRAGADGILTYFAPWLAKKLSEQTL